MSSASNLGYGNENPYNNSQFVNGTSTNNPANFSSNEIPKSSCSFKGGAKRLKNKIKNITKRYKMKGGKKDFKSIKRKLNAKIRGHNTTLARTMAMRGGRKRRRTRRVMKGGYSQYQNNQPFNIGYSIGGVLGANESALANPGPIKAYNDVVDNYNHFTGKGFSSAGH